MIHTWENERGYIAHMTKREWAIEPFAVVRNGTGVLFASADEQEAINYGNALAQSVCDAMNTKGDAK